MRRLIRQRPDVNGITEGVIWKQLLLFFFPIVLGTFFQQLYNTADAIIVGKAVGKEALAAVGGSTGTLINLLVGFFVGLASGASVIIAQLFGARRAQDVSRAVHTTIALALSSGALLTAALGGLRAGQRRKGGVQMQIRRMQDFNHAPSPSLRRRSGRSGRRR